MQLSNLERARSRGACAAGSRYRRARGFSLMEVMVALVVSTIGLLGLAKMEALAMSSTGVASSRSLAAIEASSLAAAMHANPGYWQAGTAQASYTISGTATTNPYAASPTCTLTGTSSCSVQAMAFNDLNQWAGAVSQVLPGYLATINGLLAAKGFAPLAASQIASGADQLKALIDLCHVHGIAVMLDVVYNHAGGFTGDDETLYFWDRQATGDNNSSLYFIDQGMAGGLSFALWKAEVRQFLIDNASFWLREYHADGFRCDEVSALLDNNQTAGWGFCQDLTSTVRFIKDRALQNAEYWPSEYSAPTSSILAPVGQGGTGFDVVQHDALRIAVRAAVAAASWGAGSAVDMDAIGAGLGAQGLAHAWNVVPCVENHDVVLAGRDPRVPRLADGSDARSFYARSRSKVATGLLLAAPGIPQIFMGQEFLEDKPWDTNPAGGNLLYWAGLASDKAMVDQLRFTQDFIRLRGLEPALRGESLHVFHVHNDNRVIAFHRWIEGEGRDVVVVASFNDSPFFGYELGFPSSGRWAELLNSDVYDNWVNPLRVGNDGGVFAAGGPLHDLPASASITIPPRAILLFGRG